MSLEYHNKKLGILKDLDSKTFSPTHSWLLGAQSGCKCWLISLEKLKICFQALYYSMNVRQCYYFVLTVCYTGSIFLHLFHSCPSLCPPCSASHSRTSPSLRPLKQKDRQWAAHCLSSWRTRAQINPRSIKPYLIPRCIYTGSLWSYTLHCNSDPLDRDFFKNQKTLSTCWH